MKKLILAVAVVGFVLTSCCNKNEKAQKCEQKNEQKCEQKCEMNPEMKAECEAFMAKWQQIDSLSVEEQQALVAEAKARIDKREAMMKEHMCKHEGEQKCEGKCEHRDPAMVEGPEHKCEKKCNHEGEHKCDSVQCEAKKAEMMAKRAECEAKWANFDNLTLDEQKQVINCKMHRMHHHHHGMMKPECKHEGCQHEGEEHQCNK